MVPMYFQHKTTESLVHLLKLITSKPEYITLFYSALEGGTEYDLFAKALLEFSNASGSTMNILQNVIASEFESNAETPTSIMRGNTASSRILGLFCRLYGGDYLRKTLAPLLETIIGNQYIDFEVDLSKLDNSVDQQLENLANLTNYTEKVLCMITSPDAILNMPREIKALSYHVYRLSGKFSPENTMLLVGGFVMLRFINPAILNPEYFHVIENKTLTVRDRRNLTLLCKLVQNISNQRLCNEEWMLICNPYIEQNLNRLEEFYKHVLMDPNQESADQDPFADLFRVPEESISIDPYGIDISAYQFFHEIFTDRKANLLEILSQQPHEQRISPVSLELFELLNDYGENTPRPMESVQLYYSPLCPFSRAVWLFCLESGIPVVPHKIDLLKEDQALDKAYKVFSNLSPSLQVPVLVHGDFVLEESSAICLYLSEIVYLGNHWYPRANPQKMGIVYQLLDWIQGRALPGILQLWQVCKNPTATALHFSQYSDFIKALDHLEQIYRAEHQRNHLRPTEWFLLGGEKPSLVDLFVVLILSFSQLIQGLGISRFPHLKQTYLEFLTKFSKTHWKTVNHEFEGFFKYVITATLTESLPQIRHEIFFQESPHTIYEMLLDPDNDIFLYLASKTISTKTNAKLKQGLKKLNTDSLHSGSNSDSQPDQAETQVPYVVSLDIGGEFNLSGREGTNLLLVPGKKIVQVSRMMDWPEEHQATQIFSLQKTRDSKTLLQFVEINCPPDQLKPQDEHWSKFWKKINGFRVETIHQTVFFKAKPPGQVLLTVTDWKALAKSLKSRLKEEDSGVYLFNNKFFLRTTKVLEKRAFLVLRGLDWPEGMSAEVTLDFDAFEGGTSVECLVQLVPYEKAKALEKYLASSLWKKLGGVLCASIEQKIAFRKSPKEVQDLWVDGNSLSIHLKNRCIASKEIGAQWAAQNLKGALLDLGNGTMKIRVSHKDWPQHPSIVDIALTPIASGTEMRLAHRFVPAGFLKQTADMWNSDFWERLEGVPTMDLCTSVILNTVLPSEVYRALLDRDQLQAITGMDCSLTGVNVGASLSLYAKFVKGSIGQLVPNTSISWTLREFNWPYLHNSELIFQLEEFNNGKGTLLTLRQNRIPSIYFEQVAHRWNQFCKQLKKLL